MAFNDQSLPEVPSWCVGAATGAGRSGPYLIVGGPLAEAAVLDLRNPAVGWRSIAAPASAFLPGAAVITDPSRGVIVIGGSEGAAATSRARILVSDSAAVTAQALPDAPRPIVDASAVLVGSTLAVCGGRTDTQAPSTSELWLLDLASHGAAWRVAAACPGVGRLRPVLASWRGAIFVFGGEARTQSAEANADTAPRPLVDAWRYEIASDSWSQLSDAPAALIESPAVAVGIGWDMLAVLGATDATGVGEVLVYHPITDRWSFREGSSVNEGAHLALRGWLVPVTGTNSSLDGTAVVIPSGSAGAAAQPVVARPLVAVTPLAVADWIVIAIYLAAMIGMGVWFARRKTDTHEFFLAGRRIPWWAAGVSIFATSVSAITFMAIPAKAWDTDWTYFLQNLGTLVVAPLAAFLLVPAFRRLNLTTAYEYLEHRFHWSLRLAASALYMFFQIGRVAVVTLLPALALSAVTGFDTTSCILLMGAVTIVYTSLGGIEAVIWSDVAQAAVLFGGAIWALCAMVAGMDGGAAAFLADAESCGKLRWADWSLDLTRASVLVMVLGALFTNLIPYASDQSIVQRYLSVRDEREAKKAVLAGAVLSLPASLLFFALGTAMWGYYRANPEELQPTGQLDQVLPAFIVGQLPSGVAGLVFAGLFAAAMSSLDSAMNSVSTAFTTDWYGRFRPGRSEVQRLRVARYATAAIGVIGTCAAIVMARLNAPSLLDLWFQVIGLFGSGVAGVFLLGALSKRTGAMAGWAGLVTGASAVWAVGAFTSLSGLAYSAVGVLSCLAVGGIVGMFQSRGSPRPLA